VALATELVVDGKVVRIDGRGDGPIDAFVDGLNRSRGAGIRVLDYHEHAIGSGADAKAVAYLELRIGDGVTLFGVGMDSSIVTASLKAIVCGWRRAQGSKRVRDRAAALA
jgi:2-isopropylmalate synthase